MNPSHPTRFAHGRVCYNRASMASPNVQSRRATSSSKGRSASASPLSRKSSRNGCTRAASSTAKTIHFSADFYDEKPGAAFRAQMYFLYERHRRLIEARPEDDAAPLVS